MAEHSAETPDHDGYEKTDANIRMIMISAVILTITVIASFIIVRMTYVAMEKDIVRNQDAPPPMLQRDVLPPKPRVRLNAKMRLAELRAYETELLTRHEWVDEANGVARIPIERAKAILAVPEEQQTDAVAEPEPAEDHDLTDHAEPEAHATDPHDGHDH